MNHFVKIRELLCEINKDEKFRKKYPSGVSHDWDVRRFAIQNCRNADDIVTIPIPNKSDDEILNGILSFMTLPLVDDNKTYFISSIFKLCENIEEQEAGIIDTADSWYEYTIPDDKSYKLIITKDDFETPFVLLSIDNLTTQEIFNVSAPKLKKIHDDFKVNSKIHEHIRKMNHADWDESVFMQRKLYQMLRLKFNEEIQPLKTMDMLQVFDMAETIHTHGIVCWVCGSGLGWRNQKELKNWECNCKRTFIKKIKNRSDNKKYILLSSDSP